MSQTYEEIYRKTIRELESMCRSNAERIDRLCEAGVNTDVDLGMAYTYRKILDYIIKKCRRVINMGDYDKEELLATKLENGAMTIDDLLSYWHIEYEIPLFEIDKVREYINKLKKERD